MQFVSSAYRWSVSDSMAEELEVWSSVIYDSTAELCEGRVPFA